MEVPNSKRITVQTVCAPTLHKRWRISSHASSDSLEGESSSMVVLLVDPDRPICVATTLSKPGAYLYETIFSTIGRGQTIPQFWNWTNTVGP
jgi:hypothetical protein